MFWAFGGAGRAKGLGGPEAPALSTWLVDGDGGGRWMTPCGSDPLRTVPSLIPKPDWRGEPETASSSDASDGICKFSFGRAAPDLEPLVLVLEGGANSGVPESRGGG